MLYAPARTRALSPLLRSLKHRNPRANRTPTPRLRKVTGIRQFHRKLPLLPVGFQHQPQLLPLVGLKSMHLRLQSTEPRVLIESPIGATTCSTTSSLGNRFPM